MADLVYLEDVERDPNSVVTVGTFDGLHAGHRAIMDTVLKKAEELEARSVIVIRTRVRSLPRVMRE